MQSPNIQISSAAQATDAQLAEKADLARLISIKALRRNTGLTMDFWADVTEMLDQNALEGLVTGSVNASVNLVD
tara:strand:- start:3045 stop:3266 length:222 start_codon:yes stop_codon:yes gene_type:complete